MNDKFYELRLPIEMPVGKWAVFTCFTFGGEPYGYLHNDSKLYESWFIANSPTTGLFETRLDALMEMKTYYYDHRELFLYGEEFTKEFAACGSLVKNTDVIESQVMVFK